MRSAGESRGGTQKWRKEAPDRGRGRDFYQAWERTGRDSSPRGTIVDRASSTFAPTRLTTITDDSRPFLVGRPKQARPPVTYFGGGRPTRETAEDRAWRINSLKLKVESTRKTVREFEKIEGSLLLANEALREEMKQMQQKAFQRTAHMCHKFDNFGKLFSTIENERHGEVTQAQSELVAAEAKLEEKLQVYRDEHEKLKVTVQKTQQEIQRLNRYKDMEYPLHVMKIQELREEIKAKRSTHQIESASIVEFFTKECNRVQTTTDEKVSSYIRNSCEDALDDMPVTVVKCAVDNELMAKELAILRQQMETMQREVVQFQAEIHAMLRNNDANTKQVVFPELFLPHSKCDPDEDIVLSLPHAPVSVL